MEAQPLRLIRGTTLAAVVTDQTKVGGYTLVLDETTGLLSIAIGGTLTPFQGAAVAPASAIAAAVAITGGESPTEAEFNALLAKVNLILVALRNAGIVAP